MIRELQMDCRVVRALFCLSLVCLVLPVTGCGGSGEPTASVSGSVQCDGTPLAEGLVVFSSVSTTCTGKIQNGQYTLFHQGDESSVPLQSYTITVFPPDNKVQYNPETNTEEPVPSAVDPALFPKKYRSKTTSGLKYSPTEGENAFDIVLTKE